MIPSLPVFSNREGAEMSVLGLRNDGVVRVWHDRHTHAHCDMILSCQMWTY